MRIVREYFGLERTTVVYDNEISGAGGNADEFYVVAEVGRSDGTSAARTTVKFSHKEMARMLAEYRSHYSIDNHTSPPLIGGPSGDGIPSEDSTQAVDLARVPAGASQVKRLERISRPRATTGKRMRSPIHKSPDRIWRGRALAAALTAARQHAGLTQGVLAARMARPQSFVAKVERGSLQLKAWELLEYADALRLDPADLMRQVAVLASASRDAKQLDPQRDAAATRGADRRTFPHVHPLSTATPSEGHFRGPSIASFFGETRLYL